MGIFIHKSLISWATVNVKDVMFASIPWVCVFILYLFNCGFFSLIPFVTLFLYDPALSLVFLNNILLSLYLYKSLPVYDPKVLEGYVHKLNQLRDPLIFAKIQSELLEIPKHTMPRMKDALPNQNYIGSELGWRLVPLKTIGVLHKEYAHLAPTLMKIIETMPEVCTVFYSRLEGGSYIPPHVGYLKNIVRYHLGISVPEPNCCSIKVHNETLHWNTGSAIAFDDMYMHSVRHTGKEPRCILWLDVLRPECKDGLLRIWSLWLIKKASQSVWMNRVNANIEKIYKIRHD
jgi:hypothetical protein